MNPESKAAYESLYSRLPGLRKKVLHAVGYRHFATVKEVVEETGMQRLTVGARLTELKQAGLISPTGTIREGCRVMQLTEQGRDVLEVNA